MSPVDGANSLTYVELRKATNPNLMLPMPTASTSASSSPTRGEQEVFMKEGSRAGRAVGHLIPAQFWKYITPQRMVKLLTLLYDGQILTARDRSLAFFLMEHIESDQQVGVGDTAPLILFRLKINATI